MYGHDVATGQPKQTKDNINFIISIKSGVCLIFRFLSPFLARYWSRSCHLSGFLVVSWRHRECRVFFAIVDTAMAEFESRYGGQRLIYFISDLCGAYPIFYLR